MDKQRMGEIALAMLRAQAKRNGIPVDPQEVNRNLERLTVETNVSKDELKEFGKIISQELLDACYRTRTEV